MVTRKAAATSAIKLQAWDAYVTDATRAPLEIETPDGTLTFRYPNGQVATEIAQLVETGVPYVDLLAALLDETDAKILRSLFQDAPQDVCESLFNDITAAFARPEGK